MSQDLSVDPDAIRAEGERLKALAGDFDIVADYAQDADPDWHMWGVPGIALAQLYFASADQIHTILKEFAPATSGLAQRFIDCAEAYTDSDEESGKEFDDLEGDIVLV
ncbi:type VII secretion target [Glycomyces sp. NPDC021274]|uniref:type VII secretion target n=1 Tax=Glycomyces sp. NPDC021274 TaxID=3155120 RepID=UPI0033EC6D07